MRPKSTPTTVEQRICRLALERHALSRGDLLRLGLSSEAIARRLASGRLVRLHRGVYAIGGAPPTRERRWAAAVLACGEGAALSHLSATALWRLTERDPVVIDVSLPSRSKRSHEGLRVHRPRRLGSEDCTRHAGIPVTTIPRTLIDCAEVLGSRSMERALDEAQYLKLLDRSDLDEALDRHRSRAGAARLRKVLARHEPGATRTRSPLEEAFLALVRRAGLPQPRVNAKLGPYTIDFLWPDQRIAVETDGRDAHERDAGRERDYRRDAWLNTNGYRPLRFTWEQVHGRPDEVLGALDAVLPGGPVIVERPKAAVRRGRASGRRPGRPRGQARSGA